MMLMHYRCLKTHPLLGFVLVVQYSFSLLLCPSRTAPLPFLELTGVCTGQEATWYAPTICHTRLASKNQLESYSEIPAASFPLIAHLKAESPRRQKYFFCIYSERVATIASSYFFGANKKLLMCSSVRC